jgi:hypothetical protein
LAAQKLKANEGTINKRASASRSSEYPNRIALEGSLKVLSSMARQAQPKIAERERLMRQNREWSPADIVLAY